MKITSTGQKLIMNNEKLDIKNNLDNRICDVETDAINKQTYREYIIEGIKEFKFVDDENVDEQLNELDNDNLNKLVDFIDYLWEK